ncbi:FKBP12-interacting protein of 37 kDa-like [Setaria viridis]|uniref:FKBP12-interacting protein of 37 kDa-like n=1 Tax=Setaria viridis TaxID=4556 RepID=UPI001493B914|nr:FKBP12-interacting protein of 37 kDa-like [Setaria viridis]
MNTDPGEKRSFGDLDDDDDDVFASKKAKTKVEESAPGAATGMILSLRESLQDCKHSLASCQVCCHPSTFYSILIY